MSYIFLDESGDLGFDFSKKRTSHFFVITFLFVPEKRSIERAVKKTFISLSPRERKGHPGILHAVDELPKTREKLLKELAKQDITVLTLYLDKKRVYTRINEAKDILYNFIANTLLDRILVKKLVPADEPVTLIASRRETNRFLNLNFKNYLEDEAKRNHKVLLTVEIKTPHQERGLQAVDFVSWAIFRRFELSDTTYYDMVKKKIVEDSSLYPL